MVGLGLLASPGCGCAEDAVGGLESTGAGLGCAVPGFESTGAGMGCGAGVGVAMMCGGLAVPPPAA